MYLNTAQLLACFQPHPKVDCIAEKTNGVQIGHRIGGQGKIDYSHILSPWSVRNTQSQCGTLSETSSTYQ